MEEEEFFLGGGGICIRAKILESLDHRVCDRRVFAADGERLVRAPAALSCSTLKEELYLSNVE